MSDNGEMADAGKKSGGLNNLVQAESMAQVAIALPAGCFIGWMVGSWLDRHLHQHWIAIVCFLLGAAGGFIQIYRTAVRYMGKGRGE